jgi:hypothetical protein
MNATLLDECRLVYGYYLIKLRTQSISKNLGYNLGNTICQTYWPMICDSSGVIFLGDENHKCMV